MLFLLFEVWTELRRWESARAGQFHTASRCPPPTDFCERLEELGAGV